MAYSWTHDPLSSETYFVDDIDFEEIYTALNQLRTAAGLSTISVPDLANSVLKTQSDSIRTALLSFESEASGTSYMVHNDSYIVTDLCSSHNASANSTRYSGHNTVYNSGVYCGGHNSFVNLSVLSTNNSSNEGSVCSN